MKLMKPNSAHVSCLGGWCALRDHCVHYHSPWKGQPSERLCLPGQDGVSDVVFVHIVRPAKAAEIVPSQVEVV